MLDLNRFCLPSIEASENIKMCYKSKTNSRQRDESPSLLALITKCSLCQSTHRTIQYVIGSCSGVPKGKLLQNCSECEQLPVTAKQQLAIEIPFKLKITHNNQTNRQVKMFKTTAW